MKYDKTERERALKIVGDAFPDHCFPEYKQTRKDSYYIGYYVKIEEGVSLLPCTPQ